MCYFGAVPKMAARRTLMFSNVNFSHRIIMSSQRNGFNMGENVNNMGRTWHLAYLVLVSTKCRLSIDTVAGRQTQRGPGLAERRAESCQSGWQFVWAVASDRPVDHSAPPCFAWRESKQKSSDLVGVRRREIDVSNPQHRYPFLF